MRIRLCDLFVPGMADKVGNSIKHIKLAILERALLQPLM